MRRVDQIAVRSDLLRHVGTRGADVAFTPAPLVYAVAYAYTERLHAGRGAVARYYRVLAAQQRAPAKQGNDPARDLRMQVRD